VRRSTGKDARASIFTSDAQQYHVTLLNRIPAILAASYRGCDACIFDIKTLKSADVPEEHVAFVFRVELAAGYSELLLRNVDWLSKVSMALHTKEQNPP
jgi:hypothetical protein